MNQLIESSTSSTSESGRNKSGRRKTLFGLLAVAMGAGAWAYLALVDSRNADKEPVLAVDRGALSFFRHVMEQDYLIGLSGGKSALVELSMASPVEQLPSSSLATLYIEDEMTANESYKGKKIIVSGEIVAMRNNNVGAIVELPGNDTSSNVQAVLRKRVKYSSGPLLEGKYVRLYCTVHGKTLDDIASQVYLKDCEPVDFGHDAHEYALRLADKMDAWLHSGGAHEFPSDFAASYFLATYLTGTRLPAGNPCRLKQVSVDQCINSLEGLNTRDLFETASSDLDRWRQWLDLRPLTRQLSSR